jgi:hypothetical protein
MSSYVPFAAISGTLTNFYSASCAAFFVANGAVFDVYVTSDYKTYIKYSTPFTGVVAVLHGELLIHLQGVLNTSNGFISKITSAGTTVGSSRRVSGNVAVLFAQNSSTDVLNIGSSVSAHKETKYDQSTDLFTCTRPLVGYTFDPPGFSEMELTINLAPFPYHKQQITIKFGGVNAAGVACVDSLLIRAYPGVTGAAGLIASSNPTSANSGLCLTYEYDIKSNYWYLL